ncbi:MAG: hypothetical protein H6924_01195 [Alphaproteobacteria bacterium]|nr:hypothetical protein [Alphaproteobacteria bacterium]
MAKKKKDDGTRIIAENRKGEARPPKVVKMVRWTILSDERRELQRAAGQRAAGWYRG